MFGLTPFGQTPFGLTPKTWEVLNVIMTHHPTSRFNDLKQKEIEIKKDSARVLWYETQLLIGQPNGGSPKFQGVSPKNI